MHSSSQEALSNPPSLCGSCSVLTELSEGRRSEFGLRHSFPLIGSNFRSFARSSSSSFSSGANRLRLSATLFVLSWISHSSISLRNPHLLHHRRLRRLPHSLTLFPSLDPVGTRRRPRLLVPTMLVAEFLEPSRNLLRKLFRVLRLQPARVLLRKPFRVHRFIFVFLVVVALRPPTSFRALLRLRDPQARLRMLPPLRTLCSLRRSCRKRVRFSQIQGNPRCSQIQGKKSRSHLRNSTPTSHPRGSVQKWSRRARRGPPGRRPRSLLTARPRRARSFNWPPRRWGLRSTPPTFSAASASLRLGLSPPRKGPHPSSLRLHRRRRLTRTGPTFAPVR